MPAKPALRTELLFYLSFLAAAALLVGVATMLVVNVVAPQRTFVLLLVLVALEVGVFVVFGGSLVHRLLLPPPHPVAAAGGPRAGRGPGPGAPPPPDHRLSPPPPPPHPHAPPP